ncbi:ABC-F family ATP-binding cassette domain-containing protein [Novilysobacter erysipheiresistens]|uniref:ABC-F family ATP-binding cassette domain-containing protein n=1 Tax=Novilysobacter erysipheiresistens TaxID=1749332 RepID=A0ABU7YXQ0_9GAMM
MSEPFIRCTDLSFAWPDGTPVFRDLSFSIGRGRTGLVAPNGAGKTTLLRLVAGELQPAAGAVSVGDSIGYLPQDLPFTGELSVADVLGIAPVLDALRSLAAGNTGETVYAAIGDEWDIEERTRAQLDRLGLGDVAFDRRLHTFSGGEVVSLGLAAQLLKRPDVLLLDEPTNNLDLDARRKLYAALDDWNGCLLLVSHDRALLDRMECIAELHRGELRLYGGNFSAYEEAVRAEQEAAERNLRNAAQQLKREKREMQHVRERTERRNNNAARNIGSAGLPKIVAGNRKRSAQESSGRSDGIHSARVSDARGHLDKAARAVRDDDTLVLDLPATHVPSGRMVFVGEGMQVCHGGRALFADGGIDLAIRGPERIALTGPNGAGKTTLLRLISGALAPATGEVKRADGRIAMLSQRLDLLDPRHTVAESLAAAAPGMPSVERMNLLARFLFRGDRMHLLVRALSGGERLRATLACILHAEPAPRLLLLDEPTNNLDLASVSQLESALSAFEGALVVVSHDQRFLERIGVERWLRLSGGELS